MYDVVFIPTPKYVPENWETADLGEFVQYDPKYFEVFQLPDQLRLSLRCKRPKGKIPQPVGLTDYSYMFADTRLGSVDMTGWDYSNVRRLAGFFMNCKRMDKCKCNNLDLRKCIDFERTFYNCDGLDEIDISTWQLDEVSIFNEMFAECTGLERCYISGLNVKKLDEATAMFENCISLKFIDCTGWVTPDLNNINRMCKGCTKLKSAKIRFTNVKGLRDADRIFMDCRSLKEVQLPDWSETENCTLYLSFDGTPLSVRPQEYKDYMAKRRREEGKDDNNDDWY